MNQSQFEKNYLLMNEDEPSTNRAARRAPTLLVDFEAEQTSYNHPKSRQSLIHPPHVAKPVVRQPLTDSPIKKIYTSPNKEKQSLKGTPHVCFVCTPPDLKEKVLKSSQLRSRRSTAAR